MTGVPDWDQVLSQLDRHGGRRLLSQDVASLSELMSDYRIPGVSIAVGYQDGASWTAGYGVAAAGMPTRVTPGTAFQACSISKHVAAFGALRLVEQGVLELDGDINEKLTSWQLGGEEGWQPRVTPRQLLAHTAGLSYNWFRGYGEADPTPSPEQTLRGVPPSNTPPVRASLLPGSRFRYSGSHYSVLQLLMTEVTGTPFDELMRALVLGPVGMADSSYALDFPQRRPDLLAHGHHVDGTPLRGGWLRIPEMAGAGLWTTPGDLVRLELEIARAAAGESELLGRTLAGEMLTPQVPGGFGLGTMVSDSAGRRRFGHDGSNVGYNCFSYAWPDAGAAVAVMVNADNQREVLGSLLAAAERCYGTLSRPGESPVPDDVAGRYLVRDDFPIEVTTTGGQITVRVPGQPPAVLIRLASGGHRVPGLDCEIAFRRTDTGYVVDLAQEGVTQTATRTP